MQLAYLTEVTDKVQACGYAKVLHSIGDINGRPNLLCFMKLQRKHMIIDRTLIVYNNRTGTNKTRRMLTRIKSQVDELEQ